MCSLGTAQRSCVPRRADVYPALCGKNLEGSHHIRPYVVFHINNEVVACYGMRFGLCGRLCPCRGRQGLLPMFVVMHVPVSLPGSGLRILF